MGIRTLGLCFGAVLCGLPAAAQDRAPEILPVSSFYERGPEKKYDVKHIYVGGEVENPGIVALAGLPLRSAAVKELGWKDGKPEFRGAYLFTGYSLYDILNSKKVRKARADFKPETDLFVVVANAKGEKAVFSWGEIFYARNAFNSLIFSSARSVTTGRGKDWPLPDTAGLACSDDLYDTRFIQEPVKITIKSAPGDYPGKKHQDAYAPEFVVISGGKSSVVRKTGKLGEKRSYVQTGYGHGTGYKGLKKTDGVLLRDILGKTAGIAPQESGAALVVVSAGDTYRAAFSLSEIINRGDNADFLVADNGKEKDGRYSLFSPADLFVDRDVRSMAKVEILRP